jgi:TadE-like protein
VKRRRDGPVSGFVLRVRGAARSDEAERCSSTVEFVVCAVLMVFMLMAMIQFALYFHLRSVASTAARHGVDQVRVLDGSTGAGIAAANEFLDQAGSSLDGRSVSADRTAVSSSVTVSGSVAAVIPGLTLRVSVTVEAPTERVEPEVRGFRASEASSRSNPSMRR